MQRALPEGFLKSISRTTAARAELGIITSSVSTSCAERTDQTNPLSYGLMQRTVHRYSETIVTSLGDDLRLREYCSYVTRREAIRCLKRLLARTVFNTLKTSPACHPQPAPTSNANEPKARHGQSAVRNLHDDRSPGSEVLIYFPVDESGEGDTLAAAAPRLVARVSPRTQIHEGDHIELVVDTHRLYFFDLDSGAALRSSCAYSHFLRARYRDRVDSPP
jgi:hypothetical protein